MSIESDSLNDKEVINEMKSRFSKTKSTDDIVDVDDEKSRAKVNKRYFGFSQRILNNYHRRHEIFYYSFLRSYVRKDQWTAINFRRS